MLKQLKFGITAAAITLALASGNAYAKKPNIIMLVSDDTGWGDFGVRWW